MEAFAFFYVELLNLSVKCGEEVMALDGWLEILVLRVKSRSTRGMNLVGCRSVHDVGYDETS
jgi:hypothetical protein